MILITGATDNNGTELLKLLSASGVPARAMVRSSDKYTAIQGLPGIEVAGGDFDDVGSLDRVLDGVERAFLLTNSTDRAEAQQMAFVAAAKRSGVRHIVKLSQFADEASPVRFLRYHAAVERAMRDTGIDYTFLRPNLYMQALLGFAPTIKGDGAFYAAVGDAKVSIVDVRDNAATAAAALTGDGHAGKTYTLTGPEALSHAELAAMLSVALGKTVTFVDVPPDVMRKSLAQTPMPHWQADGLIEDYAHYHRGEAATVTSDVRSATGADPRSFARFVRDFSATFV